MPFLIDGHNLIPNIKGLGLNDIDDERELLIILSEYFKSIRKKALVFFDKGSTAASSGVPSAFVRAHFVKPPLNADKALIHFLSTTKKAAKNYTVVTSDREIIAEAQRLGARPISSSDFAKTIKNRSNGKKDTEKQPENDIEYWMKKFDQKS